MRKDFVRTRTGLFLNSGTSTHETTAIVIKEWPTNSGAAFRMARSASVNVVSSVP